MGFFAPAVSFLAAAAPAVGTLASIASVASIATSIFSRPKAPRAQAQAPVALPPTLAPTPTQQDPAVAQQRAATQGPPALGTEEARARREKVKRALPKGRKRTVLTSPTGVSDDSPTGTTLLGG